MGDFFNDKRIKKLRKIAGGDTYTVIYLKLLLLSLETEGKLYFEGVEENFTSEIALEIDEEENNVAATLIFLQKQGLLEGPIDDEYFLTELPYMIGSETASARRVRKMRTQQALQCNTEVTQCNKVKQNGNGEIEIEIENRDLNLREKEKNIPVDNVEIVENSKYIEILKKHKLSNANLNKILSTDFPNKTSEYLEEKINLTLTKGDLNANIGYLIGALKNDWNAPVKSVSQKTNFHNFNGHNYTEDELRKAVGLGKRR